MSVRLLQFLSDESAVSRDTGCAHSSFFRDERGGLTFSAGIVIIGLAVLIGMVGNISDEIVQKQRLQIAADATAYSSAVWMARGMNTVCTLNHMMGEITAYIVVLEAMGGPEAGAGGVPGKTDLERTMDNVIAIERWVALDWIWSYEGASSDEGLFDKVEKGTGGFDGLVYSSGKRECGATIMDAELTLKSSYWTQLNKKSTANAAFVAETIGSFGFGIAAAWRAAGMAHAEANAEIYHIIGEMMVLKGLAMIIVNVSPPQKSFFRQLLPVLSGYADFVAIKKLQSPIQDAIARTKEHYLLQTIDIFPEFFLPLQPDVVLGKRRQKPNAPSQFFVVSGWQRAMEIAFELTRPYPVGGGENPGDSHHSWKELEQFDTEAEMKSQWVRATYPYADSMRANIRKWAKILFMRSKLAAHFTVWCNRYTLNESYTLRKKGTHMLVLRDKTEFRGNESWMQNPFVADQMFSVIVRAAAKKRSPIAVANLFSRSRNQGDIAYAQAMFYAANESNPSGKRLVLQADTGWDTFQWKPRVQAPEWWNPTPSDQNSWSIPPTFLFANLSDGLKQMLSSALQNQMNKVFAGLQEEISRLTACLNEQADKIERVNQLFDKLQKRMDQLDQVDQLISKTQEQKDQLITGLQGEIDQMVSLFPERVAEKISPKLQVQMDKMASTLQEPIDQLDQINQVISDIRQDINGIISELQKQVEQVTSFLRKQIDQINQMTIDLQNQIGQLTSSLTSSLGPPGEPLLPSAHSKLNWQAKLVPLTPARIRQIEKEQTWINKHTNLLTH